MQQPQLLSGSKGSVYRTGYTEAVAAHLGMHIINILKKLLLHKLMRSAVIEYPSLAKRYDPVAVAEDLFYIMTDHYNAHAVIFRLTPQQACQPQLYSNIKS